MSSVELTPGGRVAALRALDQIVVSRHPWTSVAFVLVVRLRVLLVALMVVSGRVVVLARRIVRRRHGLGLTRLSRLSRLSGLSGLSGRLVLVARFVLVALPVVAGILGLVGGLLALGVLRLDLVPVRCRGDRDPGDATRLRAGRLVGLVAPDTEVAPTSRHVFIGFVGAARPGIARLCRR